MSRAAILCTAETASCLIPHIIAELRTPCPCGQSQELHLTGNTYDGRPVTVTIKRGVFEVEGLGQEELDAIAGRRCLIRTASPENSPP